MNRFAAMMLVLLGTSMAASDYGAVQAGTTENFTIKFIDPSTMARVTGATCTFLFYNSTPTLNLTAHGTAVADQGSGIYSYAYAVPTTAGKYRLDVNCTQGSYKLNASAMFYAVTELESSKTGNIAGINSSLLNTSFYQQVAAQNTSAVIAQILASVGNVTTSQTYYLFNTSSDIAGYYVMNNSVSGGVEKRQMFDSVTDAQVLDTHVTQSSVVLPAFISAGQFHYHVHANKTAGTKDAQLSGFLYKRNASGEFLIGATENSSVLANAPEQEVEVHGNAPFTDLVGSDRLVIKTVVKVSGGGTAPSVGIYDEGSTGALLTLPAPAAQDVTAAILSALAGMESNLTGTIVAGNNSMQAAQAANTSAILDAIAALPPATDLSGIYAALSAMNSTLQANITSVNDTVKAVNASQWDYFANKTDVNITVVLNNTFNVTVNGSAINESEIADAVWTRSVRTLTSIDFTPVTRPMAAYWEDIMRLLRELRRLVPW